MKQKKPETSKGHCPLTEEELNLLEYRLINVFKDHIPEPTTTQIASEVLLALEEGDIHKYASQLDHKLCFRKKMVKHLIAIARAIQEHKEYLQRIEKT